MNCYQYICAMRPRAHKRVLGFGQPLAAKRESVQYNSYTTGAAA